MTDRLISLLRWFELRARVFQAGPLCRSAAFDAADRLGYIHVLRAGSLQVRTPGQPLVRLDEPAVILYMTPTSHHLLPQDGGADTVCASFEFGAGLRNPVVDALPEMVVMKLAQLAGMRAILDGLFEEAAAVRCGRQAILDRLTEVLIIQLLRELMNQHKIESGLLAGLSDPRLARAINALHADPARCWTLEALAAEASMSRARFATRFREVVGITPMAYLSDWRLSVARSLLRRGRTIQHVADEVGYGSASALSRAFSAQTGLSPRAWRGQYTE